jgi:hypothetical protein
MQRRLVVAIVVLAIAALAASSKAEASVTWPARCTNFKCVNAHLNALHTKDVALSKGLNALSWVNPCLDNIAPITQFTGYFADDGAGGTITTTALDYTASGDVPDYWLLVVDPLCAPATAAIVQSSPPTSFDQHTFHVVSTRALGRRH